MLVKMNMQLLIFLYITFRFGAFGRKVRIVGGTDADLREFPYVVSIGLISMQKNMCSGVIISNWHVLTVAHCVNKHHYLKLKLTIGSSTLKIPAQQTYRVLGVNIHPGFTGMFTKESVFHNDIAVVMLSRCIRYNEYQSAGKLPSRNPDLGENAIVTGWGRTSATATAYPATLQKAPMDIIANSQCNQVLPFKIHNEQICAFQRLGVGACFGDSGAPLLYNGEIIGIASFVRPCATGIPDVYTRVYSYLDFINSIVINSGLPVCSIS